MSAPETHAPLAFVLDCNDLERARAFWAAALEPLGWSAGGIGEPYCILSRAGDAPILLQRVPEPKSGKNRMHLDLRAPDLDREVARLTELGATLLTEDPVEESGWRWHVMADPEGNEFCCLQPPGTVEGRD